MRFFVIIAFFSASLVKAQEFKFIPYKQHNKWVVLNDSCRIISTEKYDTVFLPDASGLARVKQKNKWGYINTKAQTAVSVLYDEISSFDGSNYARVRIKNKWGYVNKKNEIMIALKYDSVGKFYPYAKHSFAKVKANDSTYYIDRNGKWIDRLTTGEFGVCGTKGGGYAMNTLKTIKGTQGLYGLIEDCNQKDTILPCIYKNIIVSPYSAFVIVEKNKYALFDAFKKKEILTNCDTISFYEETSQAYWVLYKKGNITGLIHPHGYRQTEINYKKIKIISGYYIYITDDKNQSYYINYKGKKYIPKE